MRFSKMSSLRKLLIVLIVIFLFLAMLIVGCRLYLNARLSDIDGKFYCNELQGKVIVIRDNWGVPHIEAENGRDAYFAYGYTIAQDRIFQMELQRRVARGELAEILGPSLLKLDKMLRTFMYKTTAGEYLKNEKKIDPAALELLDSFLAGINHFIDTQPLPVEFSLLGVKPRRFTRLDCLSFLGYMSGSVIKGIQRDLLFSVLKARFPRDKLKEIFCEDPMENKLTVMESQSYLKRKLLNKIDSDIGKLDDKVEELKFTFLKESPDDLIKNLSQFKKALALFPQIEGSNSWVVAPFRSVSGKAVIANDAHTVLSNPGMFYEAHLKYGGYENYGYHLPLVPFPIMAHNKDKGWATVMFGNDELDLYYETFHPKNENSVLYRGKYTKVKNIDEIIKVKGGEDVKCRVRVTPHGPIISDFIEEYSGKPVSMFWVFQQVENPVLDALYRMSVAQDLWDFEEAISAVAAPGFYFSYADRKGNIAWWAAGKLPIRPTRVNSKEILDGSSGRDEILGYVPFSQNPRLINPETGIIITANNKPTSKSIGAIKKLEGYWVSDRASRLTELLSLKEKWGIEDFKKIQTDLKSIGAPELVSALKRIIGSSPDIKNKFNDIERRAFGELCSWDYQTNTKSIGCTIFNFVIYYIVKEALEDELGEGSFKIYDSGRNFLRRVIRNEKSAFWDDIRSPESENKGEMVIKAYKSAVKELREKLGNNVDNWEWGRVHRVEYVHPLGQKSPLNFIFNVGSFPVPGEIDTVTQFASDFIRHDYSVGYGATVRRLIDYGNLSKSCAIVPTGNSGNFMNPHYKDQAKMYVESGYRAINFLPEQIMRTKKHIMVLLPIK